jgi:hypothetical protein
MGGSADPLISDAAAEKMTLRPLLVNGLLLVLAPAVGANQGQQTICCRSSGGTRGTCLNLWAHLVPPNNRINPGPSRLIGLLQGPSAAATTMNVKLSTLGGEPFVDQILPAQGATVWVLLLPDVDRRLAGQPLLWESFPNCALDKLPTRTILETGSAGKPYRLPLARLGDSCGREITIAPLLGVIGLEEWGGKLPATLPVRCLPLTAIPAAIPPLSGRGASP